MDSRGKDQRVVGWKLICPRALRSFYQRLGTESRMSLGKNSHMITKRNNFISAWKPYPCANRSVLGKSSAHRRGKVDYFVKQRPFQVKQACWVAVWIVVWPPQLLKTYTKKKIHMKKIIVDLCDRRQPLDWGCSSVTIVTKHLSTLQLCSPGPQGQLLHSCFKSILPIHCVMRVGSEFSHLLCNNARTMNEQEGKSQTILKVRGRSQVPRTRVRDKIYFQTEAT